MEQRKEGLGNEKRKKLAEQGNIGCKQENWKEKNRTVWRRVMQMNTWCEAVQKASRSVFGVSHGDLKYQSIPSRQKVSRLVFSSKHLE